VTRQRVAEADLPFEFMMNALRLSEGFDTPSFTDRTGLEWVKVRPRLAALEARGLLVSEGARCRPTPLGVRFLNEMLLALLPESADLAGKRALSTGS
jgi:oxygen-independent coproporphyrinogen-3 oxidase